MQKEQTKKKRKNRISLCYTYFRNTNLNVGTPMVIGVFSLQNEEQRGRDSNSLQFNYVIVHTLRY